MSTPTNSYYQCCDEINRQRTQDTTLPPMLAALKEKIAEAIKVSDDVGRSRGRNCYAQNTRAVVKICELQESISRDLETLAAHDKEAAIRLRSICDDLGMVHAVPETDEQLMESKFAVFGMIRRALARAAIAAQAQQEAPSDASAAFNYYRDKMRKTGEPSEFQFWCAGAKWGKAQQAQGVPASLDLSDLQDRLVAASEAVADQDDRAAQAMLSEALKLLAAAPQGVPAALTDRESAIIKFCMAQMQDLEDEEWRDHGFRAIEFRSADQKLRDLLAAAPQAEQPSPLIAVGEDGEGQENHCHECGAEPGQMCSDEEGAEHGRKVHAVRQAQALADAERWRETLMRVGATRNEWVGGGHMFMVNIQAPPNVMQGSVAQHFTAAIDAARGAA